MLLEEMGITIIRFPNHSLPFFLHYAADNPIEAADQIKGGIDSIIRGMEIPHKDWFLVPLRGTHPTQQLIMLHNCCLQLILLLLSVHPNDNTIFFVLWTEDAWRTKQDLMIYFDAGYVF